MHWFSDAISSTVSPNLEKQATTPNVGNSRRAIKELLLVSGFSQDSHNSARPAARSFG
jgi:hypothetical protein